MYNLCDSRTETGRFTKNGPILQAARSRRPPRPEIESITQPSPNMRTRDYPLNLLLRRTGATLASALLASTLLFSASARSAEENPSAAAAPVPKGLRVFTCAHSFHGFVPALLAEIARSAGIEGHQIAGISSIGGSRVIQHWDLVDEKHQAKAALTGGKVDVLTLSPIWMPDEGIEKFARLAVEHNPEIRVTVQEFWLPNDEYVPVYPLQVRKGTDHNATDLAKLHQANDQYCHDVEEYVGNLNRQLGKEVVLVVPGLKMQWDLFRDSWGHPDAPLEVLDAYCHYAVIYHRSPVGLPMPKVLAAMKVVGLDGAQKVRPRGPGATPLPSTPAGGQEISDADKEKLNRLLQELAWDAVIHHPLTGFGEGRGGQ